MGGISYNISNWSVRTAASSYWSQYSLNVTGASCYRSQLVLVPVATGLAFLVPVATGLISESSNKPVELVPEGTSSNVFHLRPGRPITRRITINKATAPSTIATSLITNIVCPHRTTKVLANLKDYILPPSKKDSNHPKRKWHGCSLEHE